MMNVSSESSSIVISLCFKSLALEMTVTQDFLNAPLNHDSKDTEITLIFLPPLRYT